MFQFSGTIFGVKKGEEEQIKKVLHRHWFNVLSQFLLVILATFLLFAVFLSLPEVFPDIKGDSDFQRMFSFLENLITLFVWIYIFFIWIEYYLDVFIISDKKIINVEQKGLFSREVSELKFERIQDIAVEVKGLIPTMLNYGDLYIQTAGEKERFVFRAMPDPYTIKNLIMGLQKERHHQETNEFGEVVRAEIQKDLM
jgi:uncharacterized membrane protein YdbT with pleckstrin-like domain